MIAGIAPEHLEKIRSIFRKYPNIQQVILFGSRAKGTQREGSDIDLALKGKKLDSRLLTQIELDYDAFYLPWKLDVILYDTIENADLKDHVDRVGVLL
ncbi:MAG: nucleotidyltransferase domain-containing protein [Deltaproteobacteria bacterium]|nr:nucleotidyltransferase domain-containing protein [Deltaproteobacteria bacterium]